MRAARHQGRTVARAVLTAGDTHAEVVDARGLEGRRASLGDCKVLVSTVDKQVAGLEQRAELGDGVIHRRSGLDHHQDAARLLERSHELLDGMRTKDLGFAAKLLLGALQEAVHLVGGAVVYGNREALLGHVEGQVLSHHGKTDEAYFLLGCIHEIFPLTKTVTTITFREHTEHTSKARFPPDLKRGLTDTSRG